MGKESSFSDDLGLAQRAREGDPAARERLALRLRCVPVFVSSRNARLGSPLGPSDLEDLIQDVVITVWRKIGHYRGEAPLEGWVYQFSREKGCVCHVSFSWVFESLAMALEQIGFRFFSLLPCVPSLNHRQMVQQVEGSVKPRKSFKKMKKIRIAVFERRGKSMALF